MKNLIEELGDVIEGKKLNEESGSVVEGADDLMFSVGRLIDSFDKVDREMSNVSWEADKAKIGMSSVKKIQKSFKVMSFESARLMKDASVASRNEDVSDALADAQRILDEESKSDDAIKALRDTDYKDADAFFKMVELLKGLAVAAKEDDTAKKYLSAVSDALTTAAKKVLGEDMEEAKSDPKVSKAFYKYFDRVQIDMMAIPRVYKDIEAILKDGGDIDAPMKALVKKYKK